MKKRIGIFSGTFDPVHEGHIAFVSAAKHIARLNEVIIIVERHPRTKQPFAAFNHRLAMTTLAFETVKHITVRLSSGLATSFDDLHDFTNNDVHLLVGSDVVDHMAAWNDLSEWAPRLNLVIGLRAGHDKTLVATQVESCHFKNHHIIASPRQNAASSIARGSHGSLLPSIAGYVAEHRLYD